MSVEENYFRTSEVISDVPSEEELALIDEAADEAVRMPVAEGATETTETVDRVELSLDGKPKRSKHMYDPERDGPAIEGSDFDELIPRFTVALTHFLTGKTSNLDLAEEYTQETFVRAYTSVARRGALIPKKLASAWLYRIAENLARDYHRRRKLIGWLSLNEPIATNSDTPSETFEDTLPARTGGDDLPKMIDDQQAVSAVLAWMPPHFRAHILYEYDGVSAAERAAMIGVQPSAMKMQASRARRAFRQGFEYYEAHGRLPERRFKDTDPDSAKLRYFTAQQRELGHLAHISDGVQPNH